MSRTERTTISLRRGADLLEVAPGVGGSIARFASESADGPIEWLRPADDEAFATRAPTAMGCFPLVPFSNRVGNARFTFEGRPIQLEPNFPPEPHAIHGHGWRTGWRVLEHGPAALTLEYRHAPDAWPFPYSARQTFRLVAGGLELEMRVANEGDENMPLGFGWHPFFVRTAESRLIAAVERVWMTGKDALPERQVAVPDAWARAGGLNPDETPLDNNFMGWDGRARIEWHDREASVEMETVGPFGVLVVFTPAGKDFFCAEPATNCIDAFNLAAAGRRDTGMLILEPGASVAGVMRLRPAMGR